MKFKTLELTLVSCHNIVPTAWLEKFYAVVSLKGDPPATREITYLVGVRSAIWFSTFTRTILDLSSSEPESDIEVVVKLYYERTLEKCLVGEVKIPIPAPFLPGTKVFDTYNVVPTGRLNISYRIGYLEAQQLQQSVDDCFRLLWPDTESDEFRRRLHFAIELYELKFGPHGKVLPPFETTLHEIGIPGVHDKKEKGKAIEAFSSFTGVELLNTDMSVEKLRILGEMDAAIILNEYRERVMSEEGLVRLEKLEKLGRKKKRYLEDVTLFCSLFPLDYEFTKDILICQWIAGGLIKLGEDKETEEVRLDMCIDTFMGMNYIIPSGYDYVLDQTRYKIGDKMNTFLQNQLLGPKFGKYSDIKKSHHIPNKIKFLSLTFKEIDRAILNQYSRLNTLIIHDCCEVDHLPSDFFSKLKGLKILILSRTNIVELPSSVENLKELRFLDISNTPLVWLPESICSHIHLQTLKLDGCLQLEGLPEGTSSLINLHHLILDVAHQLDSMPIGIGKLANLRTLSAFLIGDEDGYTVEELKRMNKLRGTFRLLNLENVRTRKEASEACLYKKVDLRKVELQWSDVEDEKTPRQEEILESLKPAAGIQELKILFYIGGVLPSWICDPSFNQLVTIFLYKCIYCISLPSLGQLSSLKHLSIIENKEVVEIDNFFCRNQGNEYHVSFPKLEKLTFESMYRLEKWIGVEKGDFPSLQCLTLEYCPKFVDFSSLSCLDSLSHLEIHYCPELSLSSLNKLPPSLQSLMIKESPRLEKWCRDGDCSKIARVPTVYFDNKMFPEEKQPSFD